MMSPLINPHCQVTVKRIGQTQQPLIVIHSCWASPEKLIALAQQKSNGETGFKEDPNDFYPGIRKALPTAIQQRLAQELALLLNQKLAPLLSQINQTHQTFSQSAECPSLTNTAMTNTAMTNAAITNTALTNAAITNTALTNTAMKNAELSVAFCAFSLTNKAPSQLLPIQRIPHFDSTSSHQYALVSYLFKEDKGGTAFYRHRKTGFESISQHHAKQYMKNLQTQASTEGFPEAAYINASTTLFEQIHHEPAQFNTCILYPANVLHSGCIHPEKSVSSSPENGRLTLNACLDFV